MVKFYQKTVIFSFTEAHHVVLPEQSQSSLHFTDLKIIEWFEESYMIFTLGKFQVLLVDKRK